MKYDTISLGDYMNLSKSKYVRGLQCPKMLWLDINKPEEAESTSDAVFETGTEVGELARGIFGDYTNVSFDKNLNNMIKETKELIDKKVPVITEASFLYDNNFCSVDILKNTKDGIEIYEVKSSTGKSDVYLDDITYQIYVLSNLGYKISKASLIYLNNKYVFQNKLELDKLFVIEDVTNYVKDNIKDVKDNIKYINDTVKEDEPKIDLGNYCNSPYSCPYFKYCTRLLINPNIFDIMRIPFKKKLDYYNKNIISFKDIEKNAKEKLIVEQAKYDSITEEKINIKKIKEFLDTLDYPLYFLDFETYQDAIPKLNKTSPYMQIPFQYSLHIMDKDGNITHKEFLGDGVNDPRRLLAESLINDIPRDSCTLAYNMSFEKTVLKNLANLYPDLSDDLLNIRDNIKDLMVPFYNRDYYNRAMEGSYSIKHVLPALFPDDPELNYANLPLVHKGDEASNTYKDLHNHSTKEQETIRDGLLVYCKLDTYAMVKIYQKLLEKTNAKTLRKSTK